MEIESSSTGHCWFERGESSIHNHLPSSEAHPIETLVQTKGLLSTFPQVHSDGLHTQGDRHVAGWGITEVGVTHPRLVVRDDGGLSQFFSTHANLGHAIASEFHSILFTEIMQMIPTLGVIFLRMGCSHLFGPSQPPSLNKIGLSSHISSWAAFLSELGLYQIYYAMKHYLPFVGCFIHLWASQYGYFGPHQNQSLNFYRI